MVSQGPHKALVRVRFSVSRQHKSSQSIFGDVTVLYPAGTPIKVTGSTGNDGTYSVTSSSFTGGKTRIVFVEVIPDATFDGSITKLDAIRTLIVIGAKDAPESTDREISSERLVVGKKSHEVVFRVDETNDVNHNMVREFECPGAGNILAWYQTIEGQRFGGNEGIPAKLKTGMVIEESADEDIVYQGSLKWKANFTEERIKETLIV